MLQTHATRRDVLDLHLPAGVIKNDGKEAVLPGLYDAQIWKVFFKVMCIQYQSITKIQWISIYNFSV